MSGEHLVFFDGECGLCDHAVHTILKFDKHKRFLFAPLNGETAAMYLKGLPLALRNSDSLILIENYLTWNRRTYIASTAVFRICWLLGGFFKIPGILFFLPSILFNWVYRLVARYRHSVLGSKCVLHPLDESDRFLP